MSDFSALCSVQQTLRRPFAVTRALTTELDVVWVVILSFVKAIYTCCISNYPLERLETSAAAEKEMKNDVDEVCRKTKVLQPENLLLVCPLLAIPLVHT